MVELGSMPAVPSFHNAPDIIRNPSTWNAYSDEVLGITLLAAIVADEADTRGLPRDAISPDFVAVVASRLLQAEAQAASNAAFEKALHKAAAGHFSEAGRLLREDMANRALPLVVERIAVEEREKRLRGPRAGGATKVAGHQENVTAVAEAWKRLEAESVPEHHRAKRISKETSLSVSVIRRMINDLALRKKKRT